MGPAWAPNENYLLLCLGRCVSHGDDPGPPSQRLPQRPTRECKRHTVGCSRLASQPASGCRRMSCRCRCCTPACARGRIGRKVSSRAKHLDFRGCDSSRFFISRGGIPRSTGNSPEIQASIRGHTSVPGATSICPCITLS